jgi:calcineurin-like phosphoesterase family protein
LDTHKKNGNTSKYTVLSPLITIKIRNVNFILCHYPLLTWDKSHYGSIHLHGHSHGGVGCIGISGLGSSGGGKHGYRMDVGVDCNNFYPVSITDILNRIDAYEGIVKV